MPEPILSSTKPYLVRAIYEWILDNGLTPHLLVDARYPGVQVPVEFVQEGQIILNLAPSAVHNLVLGNDWISLSARFSGVAREILVPAESVLGLFSRENRQGMVFAQPQYPQADAGAEAPQPDQAAAETKGTAPRGPRPVKSLDGGPDSGGPTGRGRPKGGPGLKVVK